MGIIRADITTSLDGYLAGPNDGLEYGLGEGGERLHQWVYVLESWRASHHMEGGDTNPDNEIMAEAIANVGAVVMGKGMFRNGEQPWGDVPTFGVPVYVVTHEVREPLVKEGTTFYFVNDGVESAVAQARATAGDQDISVAGGANLIQQLLTAGILDQLQIHIAPVLLGQGRRLFDNMPAEHIELECDRVVHSPAATHLRYRVVK